MRKVFIIALNDLRITLQGKQSWLLLIGIPVLIIYLVGVGAQEFAQSAQPVIRIDVLDRDDSAASKSFVAALAETNDAFVLCPGNLAKVAEPSQGFSDACQLAGAALSPELAQERLAKEVTSALITIPDGFAAALEKGDPSLRTILTFQPGAALAAPEIVFGATQQVATRMGAPIVAARLSTQLANARGVETGPEFYAARLAEAQASWGPPPPIQVKAAMTASNEKVNFDAQLLKNGFKLSTPSITVMFVMISILGMTASLAEERMAGILRRVGMMPVRKSQLLGGKLLATFLLGWVQFAVLVIFGEWLGVGLGSALLATLVVASAYVLAVTAMALALATLTRSPSQASAIATVAWVVLVPLGGAWWPLILVPPWMRTLGHLSPVAWCLDALNALIFYHGTWADVLLPSSVLVLFAAAFFIFGMRRLDYHQGDLSQPAGSSGRAQMPPHFGIQPLDAE
jgi:ABC-2 type transport system permease protein